MCLRMDNNDEFCSVEFDRFCKDIWIERHKTTPYKSQQNGFVERMHITLMERDRSMMSTVLALNKIFGLRQ